MLSLVVPCCQVLGYSTEYPLVLHDSSQKVKPGSGAGEGVSVGEGVAMGVGVDVGTGDGVGLGMVVACGTGVAAEVAVWDD